MPCWCFSAALAAVPGGATSIPLLVSPPLLVVPPSRPLQCVWQVVPSGCPFPSPAGTPFQVVLPVLRARSRCPCGARRVPVGCLCARAPRFTRLSPPLFRCSVARELREGHLAGRWSSLFRWSVPSALPARVPCSARLVCVCGRGGGRSPVPGCLHSDGLQSSARAPGWLAGLILGLSCLTSLPGCSSFGRAVGVRCPLAVGAACKRGGPAVAPWLACTSEHSAPQCPQEDAWCGGGQAPLPQLRGVCGQALTLPRPPVLFACGRRPLA